MASSKKSEEPTEFDWTSLAQPTSEADGWAAAVKTDSGDGPWWVRDASGNKYATYVLVKGQTPLDESPFDRSGALRSPIPGGIDTASAE